MLSIWLCQDALADDLVLALGAEPGEVELFAGDELLVPLNGELDPAWVIVVDGVRVPLADLAAGAVAKGASDVTFYLPKKHISGDIGFDSLEAKVSPILAILSALDSELEVTDGEGLYVPLDGKLDPAWTIVVDEVAVPFADLVANALTDGASGVWITAKKPTKGPTVDIETTWTVEEYDLEGPK